MRIIALIISLFLTLFVEAQDATTLFDKGNAYYKTGAYDNAIDTYNKIISDGYTSAELEYNLGNSYYKLNKVADCIYHYEKALKLDVNHRYSKNNLIIAKKLTIDRIEELPMTFFQQIENTILKKMNFESWGGLSVLFTISTTVFFILYYFVISSNRKRLYFILSMISILFFILSLSIAYLQFDSQQRIYAIIFEKKLVVNNEPTSDAKETFTLHEGTKVEVLDQVDNWEKIKIKNGKVGWVLSKSVRHI